MKTSKEFFEKLQNDEAFEQEIGTKVKEKFDAGEKDYKGIMISIASEYGYELTGEELDEMNEKLSAELSEEELGKVAGGSTPLCAGMSIVTLVFTITEVSNMITDL